MAGIKRLQSIIRYFTYWADAPYRWRAGKGQCPMCGTSIFISMGTIPLLVRCIKCRATAGGLSLIPVIKEHLGNKASHSVCYELSSYGVTLNWLKAHVKSVITSEFYPDAPLGSVVDGHLNQDIQKLTLADNTFDLVTSNYVFEHVEDDGAGFAEICRVLKPGGATILSIPLYDTPQTLQWAQIVDGKIFFFGEPEYHDSRIGGAQSAPVFWRHSMHDICQRLKDAGFSRVELREIRMATCQREAALVVYGVK